MELERYYGGAKALLAQNEAFLKGITEALLLTLHHTRRGEQARRVWTDFDPRPREGGDDQETVQPHSGRKDFNPRPPARGATLFIPASSRLLGISIHAPREGGDPPRIWWPARSPAFQSTPPARGATGSVAISTDGITLFQSTPPARGATVIVGGSHSD